MNRNHIARVDYHDFESGDPLRKARFVQEFGDSFANMGFAIVANHGVSSELRDELYQISQRFFSLPDVLKKRYEFMDLNGQRGYVSKNRESAKGRNVPDLKEFFHIGPEFEPALLDELGYPPNIWVDELPELKSCVLRVFETFSQTGKNLLRAIALYLHLPENYFDVRINKGNSILRLLHYYPLHDSPNTPPGSVRAAAHGDINLITLLMGGSASGLQAKTLDGNWIDVDPGKDEIAINIGDMLERHTNGLLRSTLHRVLNPQNTDDLKSSRYSAPFFLHPNSDMDLSCLPACMGPDRPKRYPDITAEEFLNERLIELGLKK